jgi:hypothetical protein
MKYFTHNQLPVSIDNTCLQGHIRTGYQELVSAFGKQVGPELFDTIKSDAEWHIQFEDGLIATVYNWKNGRNYCGPSAPAAHEITEWNIGGKSEEVVQRIHSLVRGDVTGSAAALPLP